MTYGYYFIVCFMFILLQTTIFPILPPFGGFFNLLIPFIVYLGLMRPGKENLPIIIILGVIADNLSGTPFFYYVSVFLWLYAIIRLTTNIFQVNTRLRLACMIAAGVLFENLFIAGGLALTESRPPLNATTIATIAIQTIWAFFIGPIVLICIEWFHNMWDSWLGTMIMRGSGGKNRNEI